MPKQTDKELGLFFKNARHEQKLTYEELAEKAEMSSRYLKEIENGGRVPSFHKIRKLVRALNVPPEPLFYPNNHTDNLDYQRLLMYLSKCNDEQITAILIKKHTCAHTKFLQTTINKIPEIHLNSI